MIRLPFWRSDDADVLDPEVLSLFASSSQPPVLDPARLERGRALVAARLRPEAAAGGWFGRRLAYGAAGGGGLWASVVGVAAANKAATAIGIGVLLAGGATAEISGIGPAVREAVSPAHSVEEPTVVPLATGEASATVSTPEANGNGNGATVTAAPDGVPGNLTAHVRPDGSFMLRGVLIAVTDDQIEVQSSLDDVPLQLQLGDATIRIPGGNAQGGPQSETPPTLDEFAGHLVIINGNCETVGDQLTEDCVLETVQVLGNAGQNGTSEDGTSSSSDEPNEPGNSGSNSPPEETGRPENPGKPDDTPGNSSGNGNNGNGNGNND
jgi:hypothetical protein